MNNEYDIIIDVIVGGRCLLPAEIPAQVSATIDAMLARGEGPGEIVCEGVCYQWSVRP
jgi:hypothetical protein